MTLKFGIYLSLILLAAIIGFIRFRHLSIPLKGLTLLLGCTFISETVSRILGKIIKNSNPVYHFYSPIEAIGLGFILYHISASHLNRKLVVAGLSCIFLFSIINSLFIQTFMTFNSNVDLFKMPLCVLLAVLIFLEIFTRSTFTRNEILVLVAIIIFNSLSFFFIVAHNYLVEKGISTKSIGSIHYFSNIIYYTLFLIALALPTPHERKKQW
jgi:hypothetical protein